MDYHFRAFSFVDRITWLQPGAAIRGQYVIPRGLADFPTSLVSEAVGQLASWAAMAAIGFTQRPVAGIAGRIELNAEATPGQVLELTADLESVDTDMVAYSGSACAGGILVLRLQDCAGPMVPTVEFDAPQALRERFDLLRAEGASPGAFEGVPRLTLEPDAAEPGVFARTLLRVPSNATFFADHFPRRPVFPGTLLMQANQQTAALLAAAVPIANGSPWVPRMISEVKLRNFISPGETLRLAARLASQSEHLLVTSVESRIGERLVGSAEILFASEIKS